MKLLLLFILLFPTFSLAMEPDAYLNLADGKLYSLKSKGVKDFVVDVQSSRLLKQVNDQMVFGKVANLTFRTYWTANPERMAIEVVGLPEGFKELKEELKLNVMSVLDNLIPPSTATRFSGYKFTSGSVPKELLATDTSGIAPIPAYELKFDEHDRLKEVIGKKPVGSFKTVLSYSKVSGVDGKWALSNSETLASESGFNIKTQKKLDYGQSQGIPVLESVSISSEQSQEGSKAKPLISTETLEFKNYQINNGEGLKHFLSEGNSEP